MGLKPRAPADLFGTAELERRAIVYRGRSVTVKELLFDASHYSPSFVRPTKETIEQASRLFTSASPSMIKKAAQTLVADEIFEGMGMTGDEILRLFAFATFNRAGGCVPCPTVIWARWKQEESLALARTYCRLTIESQWGPSPLATVALARRIRAGHVPSRDEEAMVHSYAPIDARREVVGDAQDFSPQGVGRAIEFVLGELENREKLDGLGEAARSVHARGSIAIGNSPELASLSAWNRADESRRLDIANRVIGTVGEQLELRGENDFGLGSLPFFHAPKLSLDFVLVPGGTFKRGMSGDEEATIRAAGKVALESTDEEFWVLLKNVDEMRPCRQVSVGPLLVARHPAQPRSTVELLDWLVAAAPFRLPSEAEWEYLSRGGRQSQLTHVGNEVPDEDWLDRVAKDEVLNPFGCRAFGLEPELCADAYRSGYKDAPIDGTPLWADGPRVVRGGAYQVFPWQQTGEWQLLCNAVRGSSAEWEFLISTRLVLGIEC